MQETHTFNTSPLPSSLGEVGKRVPKLPEGWKDRWQGRTGNQIKAGNAIVYEESIDEASIDEAGS